MSRLDLPMRAVPSGTTEFVCERWGIGEDAFFRYAPVTRSGGKLWIHPTLARECHWEEIVREASQIWLISGSFWNPGSFRLLHQRGGAK